MPAAMASWEERMRRAVPSIRISPRIGLVEAVEDRHQGRLAGAVLADDAVDRAALDDEVDRPVGVDGAEALVDVLQLDGGGQGNLA